MQEEDLVDNFIVEVAIVFLHLIRLGMRSKWVKDMLYNMKKTFSRFSELSLYFKGVIAVIVLRGKIFIKCIPIKNHFKVQLFRKLSKACSKTDLYFSNTRFFDRLSRQYFKTVLVRYLLYVVKIIFRRHNSNFSSI